MRFSPGATLSLVLLACALGGSRAGAHSERSGVGNHFRHAAAVEHLSLFEPLRLRGRDVIRVTVDRLGNTGRLGWTIELYAAKPDRRVPLGHAEGRAASLIATERPAYVAGWEHVYLSRDAYDQLAARVDAALARRDPWPRSPDTVAVVGCGEPRILVERRERGKTRWLEEECGDDQAGEEIEQMMIEAFPFPLCWYLYTAEFTAPCQEARPPGVPAPTEAAPSASPSGGR